MTNVIRKVKHELTNEEKHLYGVSLAESIQGKKVLEDERKAKNSEYKALLDEVQGNINETSAIINSGHEFREIECKVEKDYSAGRKTFTDIHTGDVVATETLSNDEMQTTLDDELEKKDKDKAMEEAEKRAKGETPEEKPKTKKGKAKKEATEKVPEKGTAIPPATKPVGDGAIQEGAPPIPETKPEEGIKKDEKNEFEEEPFPPTGGQPSVYDDVGVKGKKQDPANPAI